MIVPKDPLDPVMPAMMEALRAAWPNGARLAAAWRLAPDLETLHDLLAGLPVAGDRLDREALAKARELSLVELRAPVELVDVREAA